MISLDPIGRATRARERLIIKESRTKSGMATVSMLQVLGFMLVSCSLVSVGNGWCNRYSSSSCDFNQVCCHHQCITGWDCNNQSCLTDSDCSNYETCCSSRCIPGSNCYDQNCGTDYDCSSGETCCSRRCITGSNCYNQYCQTLSDCSSGEICCRSHCKSGYTCVGLFCISSPDCSAFEYCCDGICKDNYCDYPIPIIIGSVGGALILFCFIGMCIFFTCRTRRGTVRPGRDIVGGRVTSVTTTRHIAQANPPYTGQVPPPYQQCFSHYPPPQYQQHQIAAPPPYNPGVTSPTQPPPPYNPVYAPQNTYGAV